MELLIPLAAVHLAALCRALPDQQYHGVQLLHYSAALFFHRGQKHGEEVVLCSNLPVLGFETSSPRETSKTAGLQRLAIICDSCLPLLSRPSLLPKVMVYNSTLHTGCDALAQPCLACHPSYTALHTQHVTLCI